MSEETTTTPATAASSLSAELAHLKEEVGALEAEVAPGTTETEVPAAAPSTPIAPVVSEKPTFPTIPAGAIWKKR